MRPSQSTLQALAAKRKAYTTFQEADFHQAIQLIEASDMKKFDKVFHIVGCLLRLKKLPQAFEKIQSITAENLSQYERIKFAALKMKYYVNCGDPQSLQEAIRIFDSTRGLTHNVKACRERAQVFAKQGDLQAAINFLNNRRTYFKNNKKIHLSIADILLDLARYYAENKQYELALQQYETLQNDSPETFVMKQIEFAYILKLAKQYDRAIKILKICLENPHQRKRALRLLAELYSLNNNVDLALETLGQYITENQQDWLAYFSYAHILFDIGEYDKCIIFLESEDVLGYEGFENLDAELKSKIYCLLGHAFYEKNEFDNARHYYQQASDVNPDNAQAISSFVKCRHLDKAAPSVSFTKTHALYTAAKNVDPRRWQLLHGKYIHESKECKAAVSKDPILIPAAKTPTSFKQPAAIKQKELVNGPSPASIKRRRKKTAAAALVPLDQKPHEPQPMHLPIHVEVVRPNRCNSIINNIKSCFWYSYKSLPHIEKSANFLLSRCLKR